MAMIAPQAEPSVILNYHREIEALVGEHFQPLYSLLDFFFEDPLTSLKLTEDIFRYTVAGDDYSPTALYRNTLEHINFSESTCSLLSLMTTEAALCWLLKEMSGLRYREIASVTQLEDVQVKVNIAMARSSVLPLM